MKQNTALDRLVRDARKATSFRKHRMQWSFDYASGRAYAFCVHCKVDVICLTKPAPNEIDIGGEAVALDCKGVTA
jgi:hypothetical protein